MASLEEIIRKQKDHLTKAQIDMLKQAAERYKQLNNAQRAEAYSGLHRGLVSTRRGLQNVGLAGRSGKLISGQQKAAGIRAQEAYSDYNTGLNKVANAYTQQAAARMSRETMIQEHLADLQEQQQKINAEAEKVRTEYQAYLARKRAAEEAARKAAEEQARKQAEEATKEQQAQVERGNTLKDIKNPLSVFSHTPMTDDAKTFAQQLPVYRAHVREYDKAVSAAQAQMDAYRQYRHDLATPDKRFQQMPLQREFEDLPENVERDYYYAYVNGDSLARFAYDNGVNLMKLKQEDPAMAQTIEDDVKYWYDFIDEKSEFWNNAIRNKTKDYHSAMQMQANSYAALAKLALAAKAPAEQRKYYLMSDAEFNMAYDAAQKALENAHKYTGGSDQRMSGYNAPATLNNDRVRIRNQMIERAMQTLNSLEQIKKDRASTSPFNLLADQMQIPESAKTKDKEYASTKEYVDENQNEWKKNEKEIDAPGTPTGRLTVKTYLDPTNTRPSWNWSYAREIGWSADDYAKNHDTKGSRFAALINEWSLINGRTAALYGIGQYGDIDSGFSGVFDAIQAIFGANRADTNVDYKWFRNECLMTLRGNSDDTGSSAQKEQMDAMLTLANLMTDEERARFNALLETMGARAADEYFELLYKTVLPERFSAYVADNNASEINSLPRGTRWTASAVSVPQSISQGIPGVVNAYKTKQQDPVAARVSAMRYNNAQNIRNARMQNFGKYGQFAYSTVMSMADSAAVALISGGIGEALAGVGVPTALAIGGKTINLAAKAGSVIGGSLLGASAYNSTYQEGLERGLTPEKARMTALGSGINEMLFESLSLDMLVGHFQKGGILKVSKKAWVNWIVNTLVQGGVEGSEEVFTDIGNNLWDKMVNGIYSEELTKLREYVSHGMTLEEAKRKVSGEFAAQLGMSFAGGFASGGVMGGGATFLGMVQNRGNEKVGKGLRQNSRVMNELRNFDFKSEYAKEILQQKNLTNADIADLFNIMQQELLGQYKSDIQKAVTDGKITQEQADLLNKYEQNGVQIVKDGKVVDNADGITVEQMPSVLDAIAKLDNAAKIQFLNNEEMRSLVQAVGGETAAIIEQSETAEREAEKKYRQTVREINNDTTLSPELKQKRLEAAKRTRQNARSEASKIADTALTNKKGIGAKLETDGNGTVKVGKGSGKVTYDFSTKDNPGHQTVDSMTATEQSALRLAKIVAASRPDVNVKVEAEFVGEHENENGYYDPNTKTIHINMSGDNSVLWTLSHELTHHLANTDTEAYAALRTAIETALKDSSLTTTQLEERGFEYDLDKVDPYIAREGNLWDALVAFEREEHGYGKDAEEEVVARCCESFLGFNQFVKDFAHKQYKSAKAINKFIAQMNIDMQRVSEDARQSAAQRKVWNDESPENQILRQLTEIDKIANLWRIAVNAEAKKRQTAREETRASTKDSVQMENRINKLREEIASIENDSERLFTNGREFDNARLKKLKNELNALIEQEHKASVKTSLSDILANLDLYRRSDLISMAGQLTQAWDDVDEMTTQELRDGIREIIEEREYTPLELQAKSRGLWVRPATIASTKDSVKRSDAEYLDLARRYESGDKSVEADLRKAVDAAAKRAGYSIKAFHGTTENFNVFSRKQQGANHKGYLEFGAGFYFTPSETEAEQWVKRGRSGQDGKAPNVMSVYLNPMRMLSADESVPGGAKYLRTWLSQGEAEFIAARTYRFINYLIEDKGFSNVEAQETLKALGYDAIEATFKNGTEGQYVVFDPSQIKSADLITKDDNGNIIPLSERFKTDRTGEDAWKNDDIRFSMKDNVERKGDLIAVHNLSGDQLLRSMELGGFPMPSIAVMKQSQGHDRYGDVSVIFNKDTIDPKKSTANKVYGGDAWTPTYPTVEYKPRKTVADRISKTYYDIANQYGYDAARPLYGYVYELEKKLNNAGSENALLDDLYNDIGIMRMYGQINGKERVEDVYQEKRTEMDESDRAIPEYFIKTLGEDFVKEFGNTSGRAAFEYKKQFVKDHIKEIERALGDMMRESNVSLEQATYVLENMTTRDYMVSLQRALNIINNNAVKVERIYDRAATEQAIRNSIDEKAYKEWIYDLFHGIIEKSGIRNNKGYYTDSGNQRSWDSLHEDETLENVVRVMRDMTDKGSNAFFSQSEMLALGTRNFKSISEIREHKDQLQHISDEEMSAAKTNIVNQFGDLMDEMRDKSESNYFIGRDRALQAMVEAVRRSRTPQGILNELRQWHGLNVTDDMGRRIADLLDEIADLPTEYFEAKPRRAVGLDEIKAVIVPTGEYADLKSKLDERGIPVVEYEKDNAEDRLRALNSEAVNEQRFSKMDKVRLPTADGTRTYTLGDVTAKLYGNDVELDGGKVRQRVQMMEAIAEVNGTARVDAASEEEAEAFRRAGAEQVVEELEGHGAKYGTWEFKYEERKFTNDSRYDIKQKQKFAKSILKQVGKSSGFTQAQRVKYGAALGRLMDYLWEMQYGKMDGKVVFEFADRLFDSILNDYTALSEADEEFRSELLANMTKTKNAKGSTVYVLEVNDKQMREIKYAYENAMAFASKLSKALGARVTVKQTENAKTLEDIFTNSTDTRIKSDTNEGNMPSELLRLAQETESRKTNPYAAESEERQALKMGMFEAAMSAAGVEKSTAQQIREAVKAARAEERAKASKEKAEIRKKITEAKLIGQMERGKYREMVRREERERFERKVAKLKEQQYSEDKQVRRDLLKITKSNYERLVTMLAKPANESHVPVQLAREVAEFCLALSDLLDVKVNSKVESLAEANLTKRGVLNVQKLMDAYQQTFADEATIEEALRENPGYDPRGKYLAKELYDESLYKMMEGLKEILNGKTLSQLDNYELRALMMTVRGVLHTVYDANKTTIKGESRATYQQADTMDRQLKDAKNVFGRKNNIFSKVLNQYVIESLGLRRIAKIYSGSNENSVFVKMVDDLNQGAIEKERIALALRKMFDPVTTKYAKDMKTWYGKNAEWIDTGLKKDGKPVLITKGMRVSLAMHILNEQNLRNLEEKGVTIPNREEYRKGEYNQAYKVGHGMTVRMTKAQAQQIVSQMTEAEKAYFEVAKELFHKRAGYYINRTSLQLLGYAKAIVENYFPIQVDDAYKLVEYDAIAKNAGVEHPGFLETRKGTTSVMYLNDITAVVNRQIDGVAKYAGLAIPMRNWNAVMNQRLYHEDENGNWIADKGRVHDTLENEMGYTATKYNTENGSQRIANVEFVDQFIKDLAGHTQLSANDKGIGGALATKLTSNYVKAVLLLNARVALSQAASLPTAAAEIPWRYIAKAFKGHIEGHMNHARIDELIDQYTPIFAMRRAGTQNEIADLMKRRGLSDKAEQKLPWLLGWITTMDTLTTRRLWYACEQWTAKDTKIPIGSDAFYKEVAKRYERVIQNTQPNFTVLQRSPALRSQSPLTRIITMFGTQRMQNGGIFMENAFEFAQARGKEAKVKALRKMGRSVSALVTAAIMLGVERTLVAMARGRVKPLQDDDKEVTAKSVDKYLRDDIISSLSGSFMFGSEIYDLVSGKLGNIFNGDAGYDSNYALPVTEALEAIVKFVKEEDWNFFNYMQGEHTDEERWNKTKSFVNKLMTVTSYLTGLPLQNASKTILNGWVPLAQDISDAIKTGELNPWLHQSGKLDKKTTNANYKEWTENGFKGSEYFYWENVLTAYGKREEKIPILLEADLPNEKKAMLLRMMDKSGATSEGTVVYKSNGDVLIDFANPTEKQQALPMPTAETEETATPTTTPTATPQPTENPLTDARQEGVKEAVAKGVPEKTAFDAFLAYQNMGKNKSDDYSRNDDFRAWLFANVTSPEQRAILEYQVIGTAKKVEGSVTYRDSGVVFRDYTNESWFKLSEHNLSKDGTNKRYEAGKRLEKTGLSVDKTVAIYDALAEYTKKAEWTEYLKKQGLTDEQVNIFLWSRGWAKLK